MNIKQISIINYFLIILFLIFLSIGIFLATFYKDILSLIILIPFSTAIILFISNYLVDKRNYKLLKIKEKRDDKIK